MSIAFTHSHHTPSLHIAESHDNDLTINATLLSAFFDYWAGNQPEYTEPSMDRGAPEYSQSGLQSPSLAAFNDAKSEDSSADHPSAAQYSNPQDVASTSYSTSATPTSEYGVYPRSARSGSFPDHIHQARRYHTASSHSGSSGGMAQPQSPSMPLQDGGSEPQIKSDEEVPIDPSIAAPSPTYPNSQYSPYPSQQEMQHGYPHHHGSQMYAQPRPDWAGYAGGNNHGMPSPYQTTGVSTPTSTASTGVRGPQVYSFVPIPGAQQHKRPRRRYEEIERMYKCGWNGCEKAYGTLNHLNAHVTMQSHGNKRTPEEFKEIRKEWKARKKEEEISRKADEDRHRGVVPQNGGGPGGPEPDPVQPPVYTSGRSQVQLPPLGYGTGVPAPAQYPPPPGSGGGVQQLQEYTTHATSNGSLYPAFPAYANGTGPATKYEH